MRREAVVAGALKRDQGFVWNQNENRSPFGARPRALIFALGRLAAVDGGKSRRLCVQLLRPSPLSLPLVGARPKGFAENGEVWNGRVAMMSFVFLMVQEAIFGPILPGVAAHTDSFGSTVMSGDIGKQAGSRARFSGEHALN